MKKLTVKQLKEELNGCTKEELIKLVLQMYKLDTSVSSYINMQFADESYSEELLSEKKDLLCKLFFPTRMRDIIPIREAKKVVSEFQKICKNPVQVLDLQLYYVECGVEFTNTFGDINETFYNSMDSMFWKVTEAINKLDSQKIYAQFEERLKQVVDDTDGIGWGFHDDLYDALCSLQWYQNQNI